MTQRLFMFEWQVDDPMEPLDWANSRVYRRSGSVLPRMGSSESHASLDWSWFWIVLLFGAILLIALCLCCCRKSSFRLQDIPGVSSVLSYGTLPRTLLCQVECYGHGQIHHDIVKKLNITAEPGAPLVLFVYQVSRETEDLRNALQWIEDRISFEPLEISVSLCPFSNNHGPRKILGAALALPCSVQRLSDLSVGLKV